MEKQLYCIKNTLKVPMTISYKGRGVRLSPKQKMKKVDKNQVGALPRGVILIPIG